MYEKTKDILGGIMGGNKEAVAVVVEIPPLPNMSAARAEAARAEVQLWQILQERPASAVVAEEVVET